MTMVLGSDFKQILCIIKKGLRHVVICSSINSFILRKNCIVLRLTVNMILEYLSYQYSRRKLQISTNG